MSTIEITDELKLTTLKHLADGKDLDVVATIVHLPRATVLDIGSKHGYPKLDRLKWAADVLEEKINDRDATLPERAPDRRPATPVPATAPKTPGAAVPPTPSAAPGPDHIATLLATGRDHESKRVQAAARKAVEAIDRLREVIREDKEKHAARRRAEAEKAAAKAEVERLERQLAAAKAKLRGKTTPSTPTPAAAPAQAAAGGDHACERDDCDRSFGTVQALRLHERRAHEGFNPNAAKAAS